MESPRSSADYNCGISNDLVLKAQKELHEKPEWRCRDIQAVRAIVESTPSFNPVHISDAFILKFLRAKKFDYDRAFKMLSQYLHVQHLYPDIFSVTPLTPGDCKGTLVENIIVPVNTTDYHGSTILLIDLSKWKMNQVSGDDLLRCLLIVLEWLIQDETVQICGITVLLDLRGLTLANVIHTLKPSFMKKVQCSLQQCFPCRIKAVHLIHESLITDAILTVLKPFLSEKMRQRVHFHGNNSQSLHEYIEIDDLPTSLAGKYALDSGWLDKILQSDKYFTDLHEIRLAIRKQTEEDRVQEAVGPFRSVLNSYKRLCIDGLNS